MIDIRTVKNKYETPEWMFGQRYTASGTGTLKLNKRAIEKAEKIEQLAGEVFSEAEFYFSDREQQTPWLRVKFEGWYARPLSEFLGALVSYMESGEIYFLGEDGAIWRVRYIPETKTWISEIGTTVFTAKEALKYVEEELDNTKRAMNHIIGELTGGITRI